MTKIDCEICGKQFKEQNLMSIEPMNFYDGNDMNMKCYVMCKDCWRLVESYLSLMQKKS